MWVPSHVGLAGNSAAVSAAKDALLLSLSLIRITIHSYAYSGMQWQLRWNCETENKLHSLEPRVNVINMFRLPRRDEIIIHRLRIEHTCLTHGHTSRGDVLPLGAWLVKWIWLLSMSCFIVFPLQMLVIIFPVLLWPSDVWSVFECRLTFNNRFH